MLDVGKYGYEPNYFDIISEKLKTYTQIKSDPGEWFRDLIEDTVLDYFCQRDNEFEKLVVSDQFSSLTLQIAVTYEEKYKNVHALVAQMNGLKHKLDKALHFSKEEEDTCLEAFCITASHGYERFINEVKEILDPEQKGTFLDELSRKHHWKPRTVQERKNGKTKTYNLIERIESDGKEMFRLKFSDDMSKETMHEWLVEWCNAVSERAVREDDRNVWDQLLTMGRKEWSMIEHSVREAFKGLEDKLPFVKNVITTAKEFFERFEHAEKKETLSKFLKSWKQRVMTRRVKTKTK